MAPRPARESFSDWIFFLATIKFTFTLACGWRVVDIPPVATYNLGRNLVRHQYYRDLRVSTFDEWAEAVALDLGLGFADLKKLTDRYRPGGRESIAWP